MVAAWEGRCRKWYGDRYDFRNNMVSGWLITSPLQISLDQKKILRSGRKLIKMLHCSVGVMKSAQHAMQPKADCAWAGRRDVMVLRYSQCDPEESYFLAPC
jgi:hypothetical protein